MNVPKGRRRDIKEQKVVDVKADRVQMFGARFDQNADNCRENIIPSKHDRLLLGIVGINNPVVISHIVPVR